MTDLPLPLSFVGSTTPTPESLIRTPLPPVSHPPLGVLVELRSVRREGPNIPPPPLLTLTSWTGSL